MLNHLSIEQDIGEWVVVRTYSAGVHFGRLYRRDGRECVLTAARRIWSWDGAASLHQLAIDGVSGGRISIEIHWILITEAIEFLPLTDKARTSLVRYEWKL